MHEMTPVLQCGEWPEPVLGRAYTYHCTGMFSGAVQTGISTPVDLLKIRQQLQTARSGMASYVGPLQLLGRVLKTEGLPGEHESPNMHDQRFLSICLCSPDDC